MNTNRKTAIKESKIKITASKLIRWAGLAAMGAGILYITIQAIHPLDVFSSVTTAQWKITHYLSIVRGPSFHRSLYLAGSGDRGAEVCRGTFGDGHRAD